MTNAIHRTPCLETAEIRMLLNGPESFTLDGNFILGEAPELRRYFVCAGFNSAGIANAGGAGPADRRMDHRRRGADRLVGRRHPPLRALPHQSPPSRRSHRRDAGPALRHALAARRARDGAAAAPLAALRSARAPSAPCSAASSTGSARTISCPQARRLPPPTLDTPGWLPLRSRRAARHARRRRRVRSDLVRQIRA